jgi:hypothetical protein
MCHFTGELDIMYEISLYNKKPYNLEQFLDYNSKFHKEDNF